MHGEGGPGSLDDPDISWRVPDETTAALACQSDWH